MPFAFLPAVDLNLSLAAAGLPDVQFPVLGSRWWIGFAFLVHITVAAWSMGVVMMAPTYELIGRLRHDGRWDRYARSISTVNIRLFSLGAVFGSFAVFTLAGLYPNLFVRLVTLYWLPVLYAFLSWFVTIAALLLYVHRWDRWADRPWRHIGVGYLGGLVEQSFLFFIVAVDSYMLTPPRGSSPTLFTPSFWPELLHRFVGNLSWSSFLIAAVMIALGALRAETRDAAYYRWAAKLSVVAGFVLLVPQSALGFAYAEAVKAAAPGAFHYSFAGAMAWMWIAQQALFGVVLLGTNVYFWQTAHPRRGVSGAITVATGVLSVLSVLPSALYPAPYFWVRYVLLGTTVLLTLVHLGIWRPWLRAPRPDLTRLGRWTVGAAGVTAVLLFLLMGVVRETTKGAGADYTVYGLQTESQGRHLFQPPSGRWYP